LERLDATSLRVRASTPLTEPASGVVHTAGLVWTVGTGGTVTAYDDQTLRVRWSVHLDGQGPGSITAARDAVWAAVGSVSDTGAGRYVVARISLTADHATKTITVPGDGVDPMITAGTYIWLAVADQPVFDRLYSIADDGSLIDRSYIAAPVAMAGANGFLWSVGVDGSVEVIDEATGSRAPGITPAVGSGSALAVDADTAFVASAGRVFVMAEPSGTR